MKRMVENSEKIEELADAVEIYNDGSFIIKKPINLWEEINISAPFSVSDASTFSEHAAFYEGLTTSNITNMAGEKIVLIEQDMYRLTASANIELQAINLGTAILVHGAIDAGEENGEHEIMTVDENEIPTGFNYIQITGEPVCSLTTDKNMITNTSAIKIVLNKAVSELPVATRYQFSFIIGALSKEL